MNHYRLSNFFWVAGLVLLAIILILFLTKTTPINPNSSLDTNILDHFGSLTGGLVGVFFSLAGIFLILHTIKEQEKTIAEQKLDEQRQKIESRFFELLKIHQENCNAIAIANTDKKGKYLIAVMLRELKFCIKVGRIVNEELQMNYDEKSLLNFGYLSFYFGFLGNRTKTFKSYAVGYDPKFIQSFIDKFMREDSEIKKEIYQYPAFDGHQIRLSQYFRHLFQTVTYINKQTKISYGEKYEYMKTLRASLSPHEQVLFFYNSMSVLGYEWEMNYREEPNLQPNKQLVTKFNMIKNILFIDYDYSIFYPCVEFENKDIPPCRELLKKRYH